MGQHIHFVTKGRAECCTTEIRSKQANCTDLNLSSAVSLEGTQLVTDLQSPQDSLSKGMLGHHEELHCAQGRLGSRVCYQKNCKIIPLFNHKNLIFSKTMKRHKIQSAGYLLFVIPREQHREIKQVTQQGACNAVYTSSS